MLKPQDIVKIHSVSDLDAASGKICFTWDKSGKYDVFVAAGDEVYQLTHENESSMSPSVHPQGTKVIVASDKEGSETNGLYLYNAQGGKPEPLVVDNFDNSGALWSPNGSDFAFLSNRGGDNLNLCVYRKGEIVRLTSGWEPVSSYAWSPDGNQIVYTKGYVDNSLLTVDLDGNSQTLIKLDQSEHFVTKNGWRDGEILFLTNRNGWNDLVEVNVKNKVLTWLTVSNHDKWGVWDGRRLVCVEHIGCEDRMVEFDLERGSQTKILDTGSVEGLAVDNSDVYYLHSRFDQPTDLFSFNGVTKRITNSMPAELEKEEFVAPLEVSVESVGGVRVPVLVYKPRRVLAGLIHIHGGPDSYSSNEFSPLIQMLVQRGVMVAAPNYRGSTGYGKKYNRLNDGDLGGGDLEDVVASLRVFEGTTSRIGVEGVSYGGYLTYMCVTKKPKLWTCGVPIVGFVNWYTEYKNEREYLRYFDTVKFGRPEEVPDKYYDRSPINFVENVSCPLLIIHGKKDPRCPFEEASQFLEKMKEKGKEVDILVFEDEGHGVRKSENRVKELTKILGFIEKHLLNSKDFSVDTSLHTNS
jgi:dipeptidyl aminopeptidase/acylaminoacyl peptidase